MTVQAINLETVPVSIETLVVEAQTLAIPKQNMTTSILDWVSVGSSFFTAIAVIIGVIIALMQLKQWRMEARATKLSQIAEDLIIASYNISDELRSIRSPFSSVPVEEASNSDYIYRLKYKNLVEMNDLYRELRQAEIRAIAIIGSDEIKNAVQELRSVRIDLSIALEDMIKDAKRENYTEQDEDLKEDNKRVVFGSYSERDPLGQKQLSAIKTLDGVLRPFARLENKSSKK